MTTAFQCDGFQNSAFQVECKKNKSEAKYYPVSFELDRMKEEDIVLALFVAARTANKNRRRVKVL